MHWLGVQLLSRYGTDTAAKLQVSRDLLRHMLALADMCASFDIPATMHPSLKMQPESNVFADVTHIP